MAVGKVRGDTGLVIREVDEEGLTRIGLSGDASSRNAADLRQLASRQNTRTKPVLVVDDGLTAIDTVTYGVFVPWVIALRGRGIPWLFATRVEGAGRMFHLAGLPATEIVYRSEEEARASLRREPAEDRTSAASTLAIEGLRPK